MRHRGSRGIRRRKPVVVIGVVAAVLLAVGGFAATRAGADETPQWPGGPRFSLSNLPGFSGFGDDSGMDSDDSRLADVGSPDSAPAATADQAAHAGNSANSANAGGSADKGTGDAGAAADSGADVADRPDASSVHRARVKRDLAVTGGGADMSSHQRSGAVPAGAAHAVPEKPAPQKAAAEPARQHPALQRQVAGGSLISAAKKNVTASDISSSPSAPTQQQILKLINGDRREHGCKGVKLDRRLISAANGHAADMARHDYFAHESRNGKGAGDRVTAAGYRWRHYGENIARGVDSPYAVVDGWMHSPEHRHNILDCSLAQMGIGLAIAGDKHGTVYWVQDFATPM